MLPRKTELVSLPPYHFDIWQYSVDSVNTASTTRYTQFRYWNTNKVIKLELTSMMAACTLGFWNAIATSGLAIIFEITSSGESPIWSDESEKM